MEKVVTKTVDALQRFGERIERRLSTGDDDQADLEVSRLSLMRSGSNSAFQGAADKNYAKSKYQSSKQRDLIYDNRRKYSSDNLAASPGYSSFNNYRQNPKAYSYQGNTTTDQGFYGTGFGAPVNYGYGTGYSPAIANGMMSGVPGNVGYAPDYYIAERRQLELVPAPPPRIVQQPVPVPVAVDRPVPQPYPVEVPRLVHVDRPVPVPVQVPVPVDRPVPVPVQVPVPSPPPPPVQVPVPVPVPTPVPCYVPVGVPVPSPPPSPVMVENSVTHTQRWITGSPALVNQQVYHSSPGMINQQVYQNPSMMMNQQGFRAGSPVMMNQRYFAGSPAMGMNPCLNYGHQGYY